MAVEETLDAVRVLVAERVPVEEIVFNSFIPAIASACRSAVRDGATRSPRQVRSSARLPSVAGRRSRVRVMVDCLTEPARDPPR